MSQLTEFKNLIIKTYNEAFKNLIKYNKPLTERVFTELMIILLDEKEKKYFFCFSFDNDTQADISLIEKNFYYLKSLLMKFSKEFNSEHDNEYFSNCLNVTHIKIEELA